MNKQITILGINGSARKSGNTAKLLKRVLSCAKRLGAKTEILHLIDKDIKPCISCLAEGKCDYPCRVEDDMHELLDEIKKVDCIILCSPTYWYSLSGLMKNFLDRLTAQDMLQPPILDGKVVGFAATADLEGSEQAIVQMLVPMSSMGAIVVPYSDVFANGGKLWRAALGIKPDERLARNILALAKCVRGRHGKWF
jgi:multimeric flavodoxin WrbA